MNPWPVWFALFFACTLPAIAQVQNADDSTQEKCKHYLQTPLPAEAAAVPVPKQWPDCNSHRLYSGIGSKVDYAAARQCAWSEQVARESQPEPELSTASIFGGAGMLAVLYANGEGVDQNKPLALRLACESGLDDHLITNIEALPEQNHLIEERLKYCDYAAYTTIEMNFCAAWNSELAAQKADGYA